MKKHGIAYYEKTLGQLFCEGARSSAKIVRMLLDECAAGGVEIRTGCAQSPQLRRGERFIVETSQGAFESETLVIASRRALHPETRRDVIRLRHRQAIRRCHHPHAPWPRPAHLREIRSRLDAPAERCLSGCDRDAVGKACVSRSGAVHASRPLRPRDPASSSYWRPGEELFIDWLADAAPDALVERKRERPKALLKTALAELLPERLAGALGEQMPHGALGDMKDDRAA